LVETTSDWVWEVDQNALYTYASPKVQDLLGYRPDEVIGKSPLDFMPPDEAKRIKSELQDLKKSHEPFSGLENMFLHKDGRQVLLETSGVPVFDQNGVFSGFRGIDRDITQRKQAEEALRQSEARFRQVVESSPLPIGLAAITGTIEYLNRKFVETFGYTLEDIPRLEDWFRLAYPDPAYRQMVFSQWQESLEKNALNNLTAKAREVEITCKDNSKRIMEVFGTLMGNKSLVVFNDLTERKRMEETLRQKEQKYRSLYLEFQGIVNTIPDLLCLVSPDLKIVWANEATAVALNKSSLSEVIGKHCYPLRHDRSEPCDPCPVARCMVSGQMETEEVFSHGGIWELRAVPIYDDQGQVRGAIEVARNVTERKQAEEALRESEERLRLALQAANQGLYDLNIQTGEAKVTPEYATMLGYDPAEFQETNARWIERLHPDDREAVAATYRAYVRGDIPDYTVEFRQRTKTGDWKWILSLGKIVAWDEDGQPLRMLGTHTDITARKQAEELIRTEKSFSDAIIDSLPGVFYMFDEQGKFIRWNNTLEEVTGYSDAEISFLRPINFFEGEDRELIARRIKLAFAEGSANAEANIVTKHGQRIPYYFTGSRTTIGDKANIIGLGIDITIRKKVEEALRNSERRLSEIIDFLPDATFAIDLEGRVIAWNRAIEEMTGIQAEEMIGKGNYEYALPFYGVRRPILIDLTFKSDAEIEKKYTFVKKEGDILLAEAEVPLKGERHFLWGKARPLYDSEGDIVGAIEAIRDISERQRAEEERAKMEAQMREVQKLESLGVLAGGIAHDFNNLLMAILGNADLALLGLSPASPARPHVEEITRGAMRAADLCRQMLAYSGKGRFFIGRYNLSEIVQEMTQMLKVSVSKKANLRYSFAADLPAVEVDATQMRQVVMNLIINASESLGDQTGFISVATGVMDCDRTYLSESFLDDKLPEGQYVYLEVADTGCGMDEDTRRRIFDPFFTTKFTGRGLGLAAVLGIVRGHQGAIKVYSEPGQGTTFKVLLPAVEWAPGERDATAPTGSRQLQGGTILLVDDDSHVRQVVTAMLERLGFEVLTAANGREGLEVFRANRDQITCVLLDLTMPEMAGDEVFRELRRLRKDVLVILSSGFNEQEVTQRFAGKGLAVFVQKPYTVRALQKALIQVLGPA
jgi:PAS domain S-box-containing protein